MRHRRRGRKLGRSPSHQRALLRSLTTNLFLTLRETDEFEENAPKVPGRIVTTVEKAKESRRLIERCITIARGALESLRAAEEFATDAERHSEEWRSWRKSDRWNQWNQAIAPALAARRRVISLLTSGKHAKSKDRRGTPDRHTKLAVKILFDEIAPRFEDRPGGYTRVLKLAKPRLGDGGRQAILELVGNDRDRVRSQRAESPQFEDEPEDVNEPIASGEVDEVAETQEATEAVTEDSAAEETETKES